MERERDRDRERTSSITESSRIECHTFTSAYVHLTRRRHNGMSDGSGIQQRYKESWQRVTDDIQGSEQPQGVLHFNSDLEVFRPQQTRSRHEQALISTRR